MKPEAGVASGNWPICVPNAVLTKLNVAEFVCRAVGMRQISLVEAHEVWAGAEIEPSRMATSAILTELLSIPTPNRLGQEPRANFFENCFSGENFVTSIIAPTSPKAARSAMFAQSRSTIVPRRADQ